MQFLRRCTFFTVLLQLMAISYGISAFKNETKELRIEEVFGTWIKMHDNFKNIATHGLQQAEPIFRRYLLDLNLTQQCEKESVHLFEGLKKFEPWALRFLDSSGKMIDGVLIGTFSAFGAFEECLEIVAAANHNGTNGMTNFGGQYCLIDFKPALPPEKDYPKLKDVAKTMNFSTREEFINGFSEYVHYFYFMSLQLGICVPSGCTLEDIDKLGKLIGEKFYLNANAKRCKVKESLKLPTMGIISLCICVVPGLLLIVGSSMDTYSQYSKIIYTGKLHRFLLAFSLISNFKKLTNTKMRSKELSCLHGVRFIGISWIILGHSYLLINFQTVAGLNRMKDDFGNFAFQFVANGTFAVDTFFFMGGLLTCYLVIKKVKFEGMPFKTHIFILHRIWRMMPTYMFVLLLTFLSPMAEIGPLFKDHTEEHLDSCYKNWWQNIIFINNFFSYNDMCMRHSWYISCDFQLYVAALLVLIPLLKSTKVGISLSIFGVLISVVYSSVITYIKGYSPVLLFFDNLTKIGDYWVYFYGSPIVHMGPYCIGMLTGYLLVMKPKLQIPTAIQVVGWCLAFICNFTILFGAFEWNGGEKALLGESMLYAALGRTGWAMGLAWMITCCATGHARIINYILSLPAFIPLGRLTFAAYLIHPLVEMALLGNASSLFPANHLLAVWLFFGHLTISFIVACGVSLLTEAPFLSLERMVLESYLKPVNEKIEDSSLEKKKNAINAAQGFNEVLSIREIPINGIIIENKDVMSKM